VREKKELKIKFANEERISTFAVLKKGNASREFPVKIKSERYNGKLRWFDSAGICEAYNMYTNVL
jgi:hypothetical protein